MMFSTLLLSGLLAAGEPADTKKSSDAIQAEMPKAAGEGEAPVGSERARSRHREEQGQEEQGQEDKGASSPAKSARPGLGRRTSAGVATRRRGGRCGRGWRGGCRAETAPPSQDRVRSEEGPDSSGRSCCAIARPGRLLRSVPSSASGAGHYYAGEPGRGPAVHDRRMRCSSWAS